MKKRISLCLLCFLALFGFCLVGCDQGSVRHDFGTKWMFDANNHWKECVCGERDEINPHIYSGNICTTCGYNKGHTHMIETVVANAPKCEEDGNIVYYRCSLCGKIFSDQLGENEITLADTVDPAVGHAHGDTWESDNSYHWQIATCEEHSGEEVNRDLHVLDENGHCKICGKTDITANTGINFTDSEDGNGYLVSGLGSSSSVKDLVVPAFYRNKPVVGVALSAFYDAQTDASTAPNLESIILPEGVKSIGFGAFGRCGTLKNISLPDSLEIIDDYAFYFCSALENISIPDKIQYIGEQVFCDCNSLKEVKFGSELLEIGDAAFYECTSLKEIILPEKLVSIGNNAFQNCPSIKNIYIPENVAKLGMNLFVGDNDVESLTIPYLGFSRGENYPLGFLFDSNFFVEGSNGSITQKDPDVVNASVPTTLKTVNLTSSAYLPDYAFINCNSLVNVSISSNLVTMGYNAFKGCENLQYYINNGGKYIGNKDNNYVVLVDVENDDFGSFEINEGTRVILDDVFTDCENLRSVEFPNSLVNIERGVFDGCLDMRYNEYENGRYLANGDNDYYAFIRPIDTRVSSFKLHDNTKIIAGGAFESCGRLTDIYVPEGVVGIGRAAFSNCYSLTELILPNGIKGMGSNLIANDYELKNFEVGNGIEAIGSESFANCVNLVYATVPATVTETLPMDVVKILTVKGGGEIIQGAFENAVALEKLIVDEGVYGIGKGAFNGCGNLKEVVIGDSVEYIEESAFDACRRLEKVYFGTNVKLIVPSAFGWCNALTTVTVSPENKTLHSSGNCVIDTQSKTLVLGTCRSVIPGDGSVTRIGEYAFYAHCGNGTVSTVGDPYIVEGGEKVTEIFIPKAVTEFGIYSFASLLDCAVIKYEGDQNAWNAIVKVTNWDYDLGLYSDDKYPEIRYNQTR